MSILNKCNYDLFLSCSIKGGLCKSLVRALESNKVLCYSLSLYW